MAENLVTRIGRVMSGSVHAMVDALEGAAPEMVMQESIREIEGAMDDLRAAIGTEKVTQHTLQKRLENEQGKYTELGTQIATAIKAGRDDLAEAAVGRQMDIEAQLPVMEKSLVESRERENEYKNYLEALQAKKREMIEELRQFIEAKKAVPEASGEGVDHRVAQAEALFNRLMEKQTTAVGIASTPTDAAKLAELEKLTREHRIKERLAQIKADKG